MPFITDTFTGANGTRLDAHTSDSGATWSYRTGAFDSNFTLSNGRCINANAVGTAKASVVASSPDYSVSLDVYVAGTSAGTRAGVCARCSFSAVLETTTYLFQIYAAGGGWQLYKIIADSATQLGSTVSQTLTAGTTHRLEIRVSGNQISGYVNGVLKIGPITDTAITEAGSPGIRQHHGMTSTVGYHVDNFSAALESESGELSGGVAQTQIKQSESLSGSLEFSGTVNQTQQAQNESLVASLGFNGIVAQSQTKQSEPLSGSLGFSGAINRTQPVQTESGGLFLGFNGTTNQTQPVQTEFVGALVGFNGAANQTQRAQSQIINILLSFAGNTAQQQPINSQAISAVLGFACNIEQIQPTQCQAIWESVQAIVGIMNQTQTGQQQAVRLYILELISDLIVTIGDPLALTTTVTDPLLLTIRAK